MDKRTKDRRIWLTVLGWLVLASCKMPSFVSGLGKAIGDMFGSFGKGLGP